MKIDPTLPWDVLFNRAMQSWKDSAFHQSRRPWFQDDSICEECRRDQYVALAMQYDDGREGDWPHWMLHILHDLIYELRTDLLIHLIERPHADGTVGDYFRGSGLIPKQRRSVPIRQAVQIVGDHGAVVDLWLRDRLNNLGDWPDRVRRAAAPRDAPVD